MLDYCHSFIHVFVDNGINPSAAPVGPTVSLGNDIIHFYLFMYVCICTRFLITCATVL